MIDRPEGAWVLLATLLAAALAGCVQTTTLGQVPDPAIGASATYTGHGRMSSMAPTAAMVAGPQNSEWGGGPKFVRLGDDRSLSVTIEPRQTRWDLYQDPHGVMPFNWTFDDGNRTWPFETDYVSTETGDIIRDPVIRYTGPDDQRITSDWLARGTVTPLGSSLFWGLELEEGATFTRNVTRNRGGSAPAENVTLRFEIGPRETVAGYPTHRVELLNPNTLRNPAAKDMWDSLTFWVSPETPFIVQRQGTYVSPHLDKAWSGTATLSAYQSGTETVRVDRSNRSYAWTPQAVDVDPWNGDRPPGNGSTFAAFPMDRALEVLDNQDVSYKRYRLQHPNATIVEAGYVPDPGREWEFRLAEPDNAEGLEATVERRGETESPTDYRTESSVVADPEWRWVPPDAYDRMISVDDCWRLWDNVTGGRIPWARLMYVVRAERSTKCGFLPGQPGPVAAGVVFPFRYDGAILRGILPRWPLR